MDTTEFDVAAENAKAKLVADLQTASPEKREGMLSVLKWFASWYMTAGHKRLGRICVELSKSR
jgi:hypothetical protein